MDATHLIISIGLFVLKIIETHGCTLHGSVLFHTPFPLRHFLQERYREGEGEREREREKRKNDEEGESKKLEIRTKK